MLIKKGFSILEVILAIAIFVILMAGSAGIVNLSNVANNLSFEQDKAAAYLNEGVDAVRNIKRISWDDFSNGTYGLTKDSGYFELSGSSDTFGKYTRTITIEDAYRDGSGNISDSGSLDENTKKITVNVVWNINSTKTRSIQKVFYLTNWQLAIDNGSNSGMLVYADYSGTDDRIKYKLLNSNGSWGPEQDVPNFDVPGDRNTRVVELYSSVTRDEKILVTKHSESGFYLYAQVWDGDEWDNVIELTNFGSSYVSFSRNFDGFYTANGDFMIVYGDFFSTPKYRIWDGLSWSSEHSLPSSGGYPTWITARNQPGTNKGMVVIMDSFVTSRTSYWNGSSWSSFITHSALSNTDTTETQDIDWDPISANDLAFAYNNFYGTRPHINFWSGTSWGSDSNNKNLGGMPISIDLVYKPTGGSVLSCIKDSAEDINCFKANNGDEWGDINNGYIASDADPGVQRSFAIEYELSGDEALIVYSNGVDNTEKRIPKFRKYTASSNSFSEETSMTELGLTSSNALKTVRLIRNPIDDNILVVMGDNSQNVYTILWDGEDDQFKTTGDMALKRHGQNGSFDEDYWFDFEWDLN